MRLETGTPFFASMPESEWLSNSQSKPSMVQDLIKEIKSQDSWDATYGDRKQELVFMGMDMNRKGIEQALDACLLTEKEMKMDWSKFEDKVPITNGNTTTTNSTSTTTSTEASDSCSRNDTRIVKKHKVSHKAAPSNTQQVRKRVLEQAKSPKTKKQKLNK